VVHPGRTRRRPLREQGDMATLGRRTRWRFRAAALCRRRAWFSGCSSTSCICRFRNRLVVLVQWAWVLHVPARGAVDPGDGGAKGGAQEVAGSGGADKLTSEPDSSCAHSHTPTAPLLCKMAH
jgi:hypothetical protein